MSSAVSVALCTYNGAVYVEEQLRSILDQTLRPHEIVVSDDSSTDATLKIVDSVFAAWRAEHPEASLNLRILQNRSPLGVTANFEQALAACRGDLLALSDQDDRWHPHRLERMVTAFARRPELQLLHTDARLVDAEGRALGATLLQTLGVSAADRTAVHNGLALDVLLRRNIVTGATMMLRAELVQRAQPFPATWVHDEWLAVVAAATGVVDLLVEPLVDYRQHAGNQIGASTLDAAGKLARLRLPRAARNARLLARASALHDRAPHFVPAPSVEILSKIEAKLGHEQMRSALPAARIRRVAPVAREWRMGGYTQFGLGIQDVLRDIVQPA